MASGDDNLLCAVTMVITTLTAVSVESENSRDLLYLTKRQRTRPRQDNVHGGYYSGTI